MYKVTKKKVHGLLHPEIVGDKHWDKIINVFIITLIILNVIAVMIETIPSFHDDYNEQQFFRYFDLISVIIFTLEYVLRVWSSNQEEKYKHSIWGRLKYMLSPGALIDLMAILPFYLHAIIGFDFKSTADVTPSQVLSAVPANSLHEISTHDHKCFQKKNK
ncbi:MAG: ion transporter [Chitinophagaceae bacterium]|nr:ion transporter [Chitinophagaceae bacterium]